MAVPVHHGHDVAGIHTERRESARELTDAMAKRPVVVPDPVAVHDLLLGPRRERRM
ncbi:hypothetical protein BCO71033_07168 [Burkholderia contaminans]|uniref:Uncharacterized protein n=1 Tax=Burkholderia contaminans TaxID=488447 RepID=A0A6P3BWR1_9BURK|nr:hypothetical protein BCO71033_07168 [Burkholderia contaminans]